MRILHGGFRRRQLSWQHHPVHRLRIVVSKTREIFTSTNGTLNEHRDVGTTTEDLKVLSGRLQISATSSDLVLARLCLRCSEMADELLVALEGLAAKRKYRAYQSIRKTLKALWGQENIHRLEYRLAGFRQELTLHVTVELKYALTKYKQISKAKLGIIGVQIKRLDIRQQTSFQNLDNTTKQGMERILRTLEDQKDQYSRHHTRANRRIEGLPYQKRAQVDSRDRIRSIQARETKRAHRYPYRLWKTTISGRDLRCRQ